MPGFVSDVDGPRLLMTADTVGGVFRQVVDLAAVVAARGVRVMVATMGPPPSDDQKAELASIRGVRSMHTGLPLDWNAGGPGEVLEAGRRVAALARETGADLVQLHAAALAAGGRSDRPVVAVHHSCVATWWDAVRGGPLPPDLAWRADLTARGLLAVDAVAAPSFAFAETVAARYGLGRAPRVVLNGCRTPPIPSFRRRARRVFTSGRLWDEAKGAALLERAARGLGAPVRAAGPLAAPGGGTRRLPALETTGRLPADAIAEELETAGVFVSLALYEPFGLGVLEAAAAGCPLVLSDIATFRELWTGAAIFVDPHDDGAVREALLAVLDAPEEDARERGAAARERAARYGLGPMADGYLRLWDGILGRARQEARA